MRLLRFPTSRDLTSVLETRRLVLRPPRNSDYQQWSALRELSESHLRPFEPLWASDELSRSSFSCRLRQQQADHNSGRGAHFFLLTSTPSPDLIGGVSLSNIRRGIAQCGTLGYWTGAPHIRKGYMKEALMEICEHAFSTMGLHRLEAATVMSNIPSQRLLEACQFEQEGVAREYLKINGTWHDHKLFARIAA